LRERGPNDASAHHGHFAALPWNDRKMWRSGDGLLIETMPLTRIGAKVWHRGTENPNRLKILCF
jgi:hypothetical protein